MTLTRKEKTPLVAPATVQRRAGIKAGDTILTTPEPAAGSDEYTPERRRAINAQLAESLEDARKGRVYGPFATTAELEGSLRGGGQ